MKRNTLTVIVGAVLLLIFVVLLFTFQVRQTEVAVVTTFDKPTRFLPNTEAGLHWKLPFPIQKVYKFDQRIHNFEDKFEQTQTRDEFSILVSVYAGWTIKDPQKFFTSFPKGTAEEAEPHLQSLIRSVKGTVVGSHPFSHFVSTNANELKFSEIESEILQNVAPSALAQYGVEVKFVGIKRIGLPETITEKVFARMQAERMREVERLRADGEAEKIRIESEANRDRDQILAEANAKATAIKGQAASEAAKAYSVFKQDQEFANVLFGLKALEEVLRNNSTLILDTQTPPFNLLKESRLWNLQNGPGGTLGSRTAASN